MEKKQAGIAFLVLGIFLTVGPLTLYCRFRRQMEARTDPEEFIGDQARKSGTFLFLAGGVSFIVVGLWLLFSQDS